MNNRLKFHLISSGINLLILIGASYLNQVISEYYDPAIFAKRGHYFEFIWVCYIFVFFWMFSFTIYQFRNYKTHIYIFFISGVFLILSQIIYSFLSSGIIRGFDHSDLIINIKNAFVETFSFVIITAIGIHFSQLIIGKNLLPKHYG